MLDRAGRPETPRPQGALVVVQSAGLDRMAYPHPYSIVRRMMVSTDRELI